MKFEPPASWTKQPESEPVPIPKETDQPVEKPTSDVAYLLEKLSERISNIEAKFENEELLAQIAKLRNDNHELAEQCRMKDESIKKFEQALQFMLSKLEDLAGKVKIVNQFTELVANIIEQRNDQ